MDASLDRLTISAHALLKVQEYARVVADRFGPVECAGFLLSDRNSCVIDDVMLAPGQDVSGASVTVAATSVLAAGREVEAAGRQVRGWWHSHGAHPVFHSQTDDETTEEVLNQIAATSEVCEEEELLPSIAPDGGMVFERSCETLRVVMPPSAAGAVRMRLLRQTHVGFAFSLVVNASGEAPHAELFLRRNGSDDLVRRVVPIEVTSGLDRARIEQEVEERVVMAKTRRVTGRAGESEASDDRRGRFARATAWLRSEWPLPAEVADERGEA